MVAPVPLFPICVASWARSNFHCVLEQVEGRHLLGEPSILAHLCARGGLVWLCLARRAIALSTFTPHTPDMGMVQQSKPITAWFRAGGEKRVSGQQVCQPFSPQGGHQLPSSQPGHVNTVKSSLTRVSWTGGRRTLGRSKPATPAWLAESVSACGLVERGCGKADTTFFKTTHSCVLQHPP